jgi:CheY-like chemotaxis protein
VDIAGSSARCRNLGIAGFLIKPISKRALLGVVGNVLAPAPVSTPAVVPQAGRPAANARGLKILVAEDNLVNQKVIAALLHKQEHAVTLVGDGAAAVEQFLAGSFDLIFMDVQMPTMDGLTATTTIRRHEMEEGRRRTPIIALTAHALAEDAERCLSAGMDQYLAKPLRSQKLWEAIELATNLESAGAPMMVGRY